MFHSVFITKRAHILSDLSYKFISQIKRLAFMGLIYVESYAPVRKAVMHERVLFSEKL